MQRVFVDTNIVLDLLQKRDEFYPDAQDLFTLADRKEAHLYVSALTIANTHYLLSKFYNSNEAKKILLKFKVLVEVSTVNDKIINLSLASDFNAFEDGIQYYTAIENNMELILTRNKKDFKNSILPVLTAREYLRR